MLIKQEIVIEALAKASITVKGVLHVGAHECEELPFYQRLGVAAGKCIWIDAIQSKVDEASAKGIPNVFKAIVSDTDNATVTFYLTNNVQSSSILEFGTHEKHHSHVHVVGSTQETTVTLDTFFQQKGLDPKMCEFWNFDIQGVELMALKGASNALQYAKALYLEVNTEEVYKGCAKLGEIDAFLETRGFKRVLTDITPYGWGDALYVRNPKLSLCIPTMNRFSFLKTNLPQYLANPYIDEIVISDETGDDVAKIREHFSDSKLKLFVNSERLGAFLNKEQAVRHATNEWVALIDSDNFAPVSYFETWNRLQSYSPTTIYAPSRTIATHNHGGFDNSILLNTTLSRHNVLSLLRAHNIVLENVINMGNYIVNRTFYLESSDPNYSDLYKTTNAWEAKLRTWLLLNKGANYVFPSGLEYYHSIHDGSLYSTTEREIHVYSSRITDMYNSFV